LGGCEFFSVDRKIDVEEAKHVDADKEQPDGDDVEQEGAVVSLSNAAVEPLAVVIEPVDALVADVAMAGFLGSHDLTGRAQVRGVKVLVQSQERDLGRLLNEPRLFAADKRIEGISQDEKPEERPLELVCPGEWKHKKTQEDHSHRHHCDIAFHGELRLLELFKRLLQLQTRNVDWLGA